ncbi:hypothetical protein [Saccharopolyspora gregorii]|uniref:Uncharacterized protein n=1 Tax=Saccharopolyspora gregorii TaxID=33914 RepID=A0ABP6RZE2_9PSEU|nr:hypothetical protein [Saccharopolyspora gregorii]
MVNKKLKPAKVLSLARRAARGAKATIKEIPGRGKGSHRIFAVYDRDGAEVARFGLTGHNKEISWHVLTHVETGLAPVFGEKWLEDR